jgi:hypothetical protein
MRYNALVVAIAICTVTAPATAQTLTTLTPPDTAHDPYGRYVRPGQCVQAAIRFKDAYWRDKRPDTVRYAPTTDSVPASVIKAVRQCASRFNVAKVPERDLLGLVQLYLWAQQDSLAKAAADRLLAAEANLPAVQRGWTLHLLVQDLLDLSPTRFAWVKRYLAQLDSLGQPAATWQMLAHTAVAKYDMTVNDRSGALADGKTAIAASHAMSKNDQMDWTIPLIMAYDALAFPTSLLNGGKATLALYDTAKAVITPLRKSQQDLMQLLPLLDQLRQRYTLIDTKAQPIVGKHWYHVEGDTTVRPKPSVVTLVFVPQPLCGGQCFQQYATIHRLQDKYGTAGLHIVSITESHGFFKNHAEPDPAHEANDLQDYLLGYLKLPGPLAITETQFHPLFDGRRIGEPGPNHKNYIIGGSGILVGKDGIIHMVSSVGPKSEDALAAEIAALLKQ